ncbi:MAG: DNA polymerase III subunit beta [Acidimicrobiia bacterium]
MKLSVERDLLADLVNRAKNVSRNGSIQVEATTNNELIVTVGGPYASLVQSCEANVTTEGEVVLHTPTFNDILSRTSGTQLEIEADEDQVEIRGNVAAFNIGTVKQPPPTPFEMPAGEGLVIETDQLFSAIKTAATATATGSSNAALNGVNIAPTPEGLRIVATDQFGLVSISLPDQLVFSGSVTIPQEVCSQASTILNGEDKVVLHLTDKQIFFESDTKQLRAQLISEPFPRIDPLLNVGGKHATFDTTDFEEVVKAVGIAPKATFTFTPISATEANCIVTGRLLETAVTAQAVVGWDGGDMEISFLLAQLTAAQKFMADTEQVKLQIAAPLKPVMVQSEQKPDTLYVMSPTR